MKYTQKFPHICHECLPYQVLATQWHIEYRWCRPFRHVRGIWPVCDCCAKSLKSSMRIKSYYVWNQVFVLAGVVLGALAVKSFWL